MGTACPRLGTCPVNSLLSIIPLALLPVIDFIPSSFSLVLSFLGGSSSSLYLFLLSLSHPCCFRVLTYLEKNNRHFEYRTMFSRLAPSEPLEYAQNNIRRGETATYCPRIHIRPRPLRTAGRVRIALRLRLGVAVTTASTILVVSAHNNVITTAGGRARAHAARGLADLAGHVLPHAAQLQVRRAECADEHCRGDAGDTVGACWDAHAAVIAAHGYWYASGDGTSLCACLGPAIVLSKRPCAHVCFRPRVCAFEHKCDLLRPATF